MLRCGKYVDIIFLGSNKYTHQMVELEIGMFIDRFDCGYFAVWCWGLIWFGLSWSKKEIFLRNLEF